ncbi:MAG: type II toxin-antitoxin system PemK/MazF family toxin [Bryobacteraceae bacterium]
MSRPPRRGNAYWIGLDPVVGTEMQKTRPAVIVSNDDCNRYGTRLVALPETSNGESLFLGEVLLRIRGKQGARPIRFGRLTRAAAEVALIDEALAITLALPYCKLAGLKSRAG